MKKSLIKTIVTLSVGMMIGSATLAVAAPSTVEAVLTKFKIIVNGQEAQLANNPLVYKGTTYLPVREVAGLLNTDLNYDGQAKKIELTSKGVNDVIQTNEIKPTYNIGDTFTLGSTTFHIIDAGKSASLKSDEGDYIANEGEIFAFLTADITTSYVPSNDFGYPTFGFLKNMNVGGKEINNSIGSFPYSITKDVKTKATIYRPIPTIETLESITVIDPTTKDTATINIQ